MASNTQNLNLYSTDVTGDQVAVLGAVDVNAV